MAFNKLDVIKIKQARIRLLTNLLLFNPTPVKLKTLYQTVCDDPTYDESCFHKDIWYFEQKGYIEFIESKLGITCNFGDRVCGLTAKGKEVAEGTATDPALEI